MLVGKVQVLKVKKVDGQRWNVGCWMETKKQEREGERSSRKGKTGNFVWHHPKVPKV